MLWALSHESGLPAKRFAALNPAPPIEWLEAFSEDRYQHGDLSRFNVQPRAVVDENLRFSLIRRPAPYGRAPWMSLVSAGVETSQWDNVMDHLARWLVRHLNDPTLIIWLAQHGAQMHDGMRWHIEHELDRLADLAHKGSTTELNDIRTHAPNAIPGPPMQVLWRILLTGRVKSLRNELSLYRWKDQLKRDGLTITMRLELRELLSPKVMLKKRFRWDGEAEETSTVEPTTIKQLVNWELVLAADHVRSALRGLTDDGWRASLPALLDDFQQLLRDALDLRRELGKTDERSDESHWELPSISSHQQNRDFRDWVTLIELLRDAWLATVESDPKRAGLIALAWFDLPYSTFKRLAMFAASRGDCFDPERWVEWLVLDDSWWLWSLDTRRETMRLLVLQGAQLSPCVRATLETAILIGPPRRMYRDDLALDRWQKHLDHSVWLRLAKLREGVSQLGDAATQRIDDLENANPEWRLASDERDEFSHWMSGNSDIEYESGRSIGPRKKLKERWRVALQAWSEEGKVQRSWRLAAPLVNQMSDAMMQENVHGVTAWMKAASKSIERNDDILLNLCRRVLTLPLETETGILQNGKPIDQPVTEAINHPIGHVTQALLNLWLLREPGDNDPRLGDIEPLFRQICDIGTERFRHGRVLLASRLITLFRADRLWTETHLLPLFDWSFNVVEAKAAWEGFLWSPRLYGPLFIAFKSQFLCTVKHYGNLGEYRSQFAAILTYAALEPVESYVPDDFRIAIGLLPLDGLEEVAQVLLQALESAGVQRIPLHTTSRTLRTFED